MARFLSYGNSVHPKSQVFSQNKFCPAVDKEEKFFHRNLYVDSEQNTVAIFQSVEIRKILESAY